MAEEKVVVLIHHDAQFNIHRTKTRGEEKIEDIVIARFEPEKQALWFKDLKALNTYKVSAVTYLADNEFLVKIFQREDLKPDPEISEIPVPRPKKNKHEGDKTKAVVEWYMRYRPNEFASRYGVLGVYSGPVRYKEPTWQPRPGDGELEYRGEVFIQDTVTNAIVAERKTHLSFTPEECTNWDEEEPDSEAMQEEAPKYIPPEPVAGKGPKPSGRKPKMETEDES